MLEILASVVRYGVGALLLFSFTGKALAGRSVNSGHLERYRLLPAVAVSLVARFLPPLEFLLGVALVLGIEARATAAAAGVLFIVFAGAMGSALQRRIVTHCGCYGTLYSSQVSPTLVLRNLVIVVLLAVVVAMPGRGFATILLGPGSTLLVLGSSFLVGLVLSEVMSVRARVRSPLAQ